jgi:hypothetical protein
MSLEQQIAEIIAKMKSNNGTHALYILWLEEALQAAEDEDGGRYGY